MTSTVKTNDPYLSEGPHKSTIDTHELLMIDHVGLVQNNADLVLVSSKSLDTALELVGDVQFVSIEEKDDTVDPLGEPFQDSSEVVSTVDPKNIGL